MSVSDERLAKPATLFRHGDLTAPNLKSRGFGILSCCCSMRVGREEDGGLGRGKVVVGAAQKLLLSRHPCTQPALCCICTPTVVMAVALDKRNTNAPPGHIVKSQLKKS